MKINFLHISDLHYDSKKTTHFESIKDKLLEALEQMDSINFIVFSGDLVQRPLDGEFLLAYNKFIEPILSKMSISSNSLIITNGNHDVNITKRNKYTFLGLKSCIENNDKSVVKDLLSNNIDLHEHDEYKQFTDSLSQDYTISNNLYYRTQKKSFSNLTIGFLSLNTSLLMEGSNKDFSKLWIFKEILEKAFDDIKSCNMKILNMHHPLNWFTNYKEIEKFILDKFNIVFFGHEHEFDGKYTIDTCNRDILYLHAQSLFHNSNLPDGFTHYSYSIHNEELNINKFIYDKSQNYYTKSETQLLENIDLLKKSKQIRNQHICSVIKEPVTERINKFLAINLTSETSKKDIQEIYIHQKITNDKEKDTENKKRNLEQEEKEYSLEELIEKNSNILFLGKKEIGKTTLLNMINLTYLSNYGEKIPIYISGNALVNERKISRFATQIIDYLNKFYGKNKFKITNMIEEKRFIFFIDNIEYLDNDFVLELINLDNRVIATYTTKDYADITTKLNSFDLKSANLNLFEKFRINPLRQKDSTNLTKKIISDESSKQISSNVIKTINNLSLPSNPFLVTLLIWMYRDKIEIRESEPQIIDVLLDYLLEKSDIKNKFDSRINFDDKKNILSFISYLFFDKRTLSLNENEILQRIIDYIKSYFAFSINANDILQYFYDRRVFISHNGQVQFTYKVFYYYFIALQIKKDDNFKNHIFTSPHLLSNMYEELKFYSALNDKNIQEIDNIESFINDNWFNSKMKSLSNYIPSNLVKAEGSSNNDLDVITEEINEIDTPITEEEQIITDKIDTIKTERREVQVEEYNNKSSLIDILFQYKEEYFVLNLIYSEFIKNLKNVEVDIQNKYVKKSIYNFSNITKYWFSKIDDEVFSKRFLQIKLKEKIANNHEIHEFKELVKSQVLCLITEMMEVTLCTLKMVDIYSNNFDLENDPFIKFYLLILVLETESEDLMLNYVNNFIKTPKLDKSFLFILFGKLIHDYNKKSYLSKTKKEIKNILVHIELKLSGAPLDKNGQNKATAISRVEENIKMNRMLN